MHRILLLSLVVPGILAAQVSRTTTTRPTGTILRQPTATTDPTVMQLSTENLADMPAPAVQLRDPAPGSVTLAWNAVPGVSGYSVTRNDLGPLTPAPLPAGSTTFTHVASNDYRVTYQYQVVALYPNGHSGPGAPLAFQPPKPENATEFRAEITRSTARLTWKAPPGVHHFLLGGSGFDVNGKELPGSATSMDVPNLPLGEHSWSLGAYYAPGNVSTWGGEWPTATATARPFAPTDIRVETYGGGGTVDFRWTPVSGFTWYEVHRSESPTGGFAESGMIYAKNQNGTWVLPRNWARQYDLPVGKTFYYRLVVMQAPGVPVAESENLVVTVAPKLPGVANLTATSPGPGRVVLSWAPAANALHYFIMRGKGTEPMAFVAREFPGTTYEDANLWAGATYRYTVSPFYGHNRVGELAGASVTVAP